ncbi:MAG: hypothetical protein INR73_21260 [Williamsia sp.]|nr:hypothetical protein [Williamsia sp.]
MKYPSLLIRLFVAALLLTGCKALEKGGDKLGTGLNKNTKQMGRNLVSGLQEGLADSRFREDLKKLLDTVIQEAGWNANKAALALRDSLLSEKWSLFTRQLVEDLSGQQTRENLALLREALVGDTTRLKVKRLLAEAMNEVLNEQTYQKLAALRDELLGARTEAQLAVLRDQLLGEKTNAAIKAIVDTAMVTIAYRMRHDVKDAVDENASFIQKYAGRLLILLGAIAAVIILLVWRNRQKYLKLVTLLTANIHDIPDQGTYDDLTTRIKRSALVSGVEPTLRKVLKENGLVAEQAVAGK